MKRYNLGLVSVSFRGHTPEEILSAMNAAGLTCIEWGSDVHAPRDDTARLRELAGLQRAYKIACCSYGTYFRLGTDELEDLEQYMDAAEILGTDVLRLWCGNKNSQEYTQRERETLFQACAEAAKIAEKRGITLCMECHNKTYTNEKEAAYELMQAMDSPHFRMYWQPNQHRSTEENLAYIRLLSDYTHHIHVFHWIGKEKHPLREGVRVWQEYLQGFSDDKTLLLEFMPDHQISSLRREADALREIVECKL